MKALRKVGPGLDGVELQDVPQPSAGPGELLVRIAFAGICGTDLHIVKDEYPSERPVTMGHEYAGTVVGVGQGVAGFDQGDRVVSLTAASTCGHCRFCRQGLLMLCPERKSIGSGVDGAFAEYMRIPAHLAFRIPENVSLKEAALTEPLACIVRSVLEQSWVRAGDVVLVSGPGAIGLIVQQVAMASGARVVVAGTPADAARLELARKLGAAAAADVSAEDPLQAASELLDGVDGFDVVFECAGHPASADTCVRCVKKTGIYTQVGLFGGKVGFDHDALLKKEVSIFNSYASERSSWERALRLLRFGLVDLKPLASAVHPLSEWRAAFGEAFDKKGFKILFEPGI